MALDKRGAVIGMFGDVIKNNAAAPVNANVVAITALARRLERSCHNNTVTKSIAAHIEPSYDCDKFVAEYSRQCYLIAAKNAAIRKPRKKYLPFIRAQNVAQNKRHRCLFKADLLMRQIL
jgi:hypothetical protein